ncbi:ARM repeat-containing protein [Patellaria atrata CBS 101060]|uniref:ARM repeat-containing protein n=1 Tax=Patellaria atrata CBS 101060 TaxID=1346257 RepID=A0A9P4S2I7_9PEZI|nr:ARM repeat-containing protein [Patellaria atrata CBS 101060]
MLETARDLTLEAARDATAARRSATRGMSTVHLKKLLDSRSERDVLEGLRRVIAMSYRQEPTHSLFTHLIKNIASPSLEIKKLVYAYLLQHAESSPDTALLSINSIQKSLTDQNPQLRALALRVMSGIRVPVISQIVSLGIKRGVGDMSPYVRKAAALAILKCYRLDPGTEPQMIEYLAALLGDKQYFVAGAAVSAFLEVCPDRLDLIHPHYRSLLRKLLDMDEWSQLDTLRLMGNYARRCFPRRKRRVKRLIDKRGTSTNTKGFYDGSSSGSEENTSNKDAFYDEIILDPDLSLLLESAASLLQSRNSAVVLAVTRTYLYLGTDSHVDQAIGPLIALLRSASDIQYIALHNIIQVCLLRPKAFVPYATHFLVRSTDAPHIWQLKLELLTLIYPLCTSPLQGLILSELDHLSRGHDTLLVREAVRAVGRCAQNSDGSTSSRCLRLLLSHIHSPDGHLVAESLEVVRHLIQRDPATHQSIVIRLAKNLDTLTNPYARASIIWLVGEFAGIDPENNIAADVLRILVKGFVDEAEVAKLQIVLLAAKVYVHYLNLTQPTASSFEQSAQVKTSTVLAPNDDEDRLRESTFAVNKYEPDRSAEDSLKGPEHPIVVIWRYIQLLSRYDTSYDLRDRARLYRSLLAVPSSTQLASLVLLAPKPVPQAPSPSETRRDLLLGSSSLIVGEEGGIGGLRGYEKLPDWVKESEEPNPGLREEGFDNNYGEKREVSASEKLEVMESEKTLSNNVVGGSNTNGHKQKALNDWLDESDSEEGETEEETDEETTEDDSEGEGSETDEGEKVMLMKER